MMRPLQPVAPVLAKAASSGVPSRFNMEQNHPNPFNMQTQISFYLPERSEVKLAIYNILGQKVKTLAGAPMEAGTHTVTWDGKNETGSTVASGVYFYKLNAGNEMITKKMTMLK